MRPVATPRRWLWRRCSVPGSNAAPQLEVSAWDRLVAELAEALIALPADAWVEREEDVYRRYGSRTAGRLRTLSQIRDYHTGGS